NGTDRRRPSSGGTTRRGAPRAYASVASSSRARAAGLGTDRRRLSPSEASVRRFELVLRLLLPMNLHEELLHVAIESALTHLVGLDLDEGVVAALRSRRELHRAQGTRIGSRPRRGHLLRDTNRGKEFIGDRERVSRRNVAAVEMSHRRIESRCGTESRSGRTCCVQLTTSIGERESRRKRSPICQASSIRPVTELIAKRNRAW